MLCLSAFIGVHRRPFVFCSVLRHGSPSAGQIARGAIAIAVGRRRVFLRRVAVRIVKARHHLVEPRPHVGGPLVVPGVVHPLRSSSGSRSRSYISSKSKPLKTYLKRSVM